MAGGGREVTPVVCAVLHSHQASELRARSSRAHVLAAEGLLACEVQDLGGGDTGERLLPRSHALKRNHESATPDARMCPFLAELSQ
jgi:hypothetical protein